MLSRYGLILVLSGLSVFSLAAQETSRRDALGDPLPTGALHRLGTVRLRQSNSITALAFTPDGKQLISATYSQKLTFWDVDTGKLAKEWTIGTTGVTGIEFSKDGKLAAVAGNDGTIRILDGKTGTEKRILQDPMRRYGNLHIALSPNGKWMVMIHRYDRQMLIWNVESGKLEHRIANIGSYYQPPLAFTSDSKQIVTLWSDNRLHLVDLASGKSVRTLEPKMPTGTSSTYNLRIPSLALTPDDKQVIYRTTSDRNFLVADVATGNIVKRITNTSGNYYSSSGSMTITPNGRFLIESSNSNSIHVWGLASGKKLRELRVPYGSVYQLAVSPDGKRVASCYSGSIFLWDVTEGKMMHDARGHLTAVTRLAFTPDNKKIISVGSSSMRLWDAETGKELIVAKGVAGGYGMNYLSTSKDGKTVQWIGGDRARWQWEPEKKTTPLRLTNPRTTAYFSSQAVSSDGKWLAGVDNRDRKLRLFDLLGTDEQRDLTILPNAYSNSLVFSPDNRFLALASSDRSVSIYHVSTATEIRKLMPDLGPGRVASGNVQIQFSPDGQSLLLYDGDLRVVETISGMDRVRLPRESTIAPSQMAWSDDGRLVARGHSDGFFFVYDTYSGRELLRRNTTQGSLYSLAFSRDGRKLATGGADTTVLLWDLPEVAKIAPLAGRSVANAWKDLENPDATRAFQSMIQLIATPEETIKTIRDQLKPPVPVDSKRIAKLIEELDSDTFAVRDNAGRQLEAIGRAAESALEKALKHPSLEVRRKVETLLAKVRGGTGLAPDRLRAIRAIEVLERIGTPAAGQALKALLKTSLDAALEQSIKAALARIGESA